ncbi:MAG: carboxylating nicotinate-nucleotide diphosphorylase [Phycisphaerae bacterium]|nr:carboxylating nicotinate-nucleotide diphosphorylase [Phycisphaerae bacterium]
MSDPNGLPLHALYAALAQSGLIARLLELARDEDLGPAGDATSAASIPPDAAGSAIMVARTGGRIAGLAALPDLALAFGARLRIDTLLRDGHDAQPGQPIARLAGPARDLLAIERTALNLVSRLSGVATRTAAFAARLADARVNGRPAHARLYDTRKTTPGLRVLEKYAVRCGGGHCHRIGLFDAVLIKDNHLAGVAVPDLPGVVARAAASARAARPAPAFVEVEVDSLDQFRALLTLPRGTVDIVLLDNMTLDQLRHAVALRDASASRPELEASGGVTLDSVRAIAQTGVDRISAGTLTHGATWLDIALDFEPTP